MQQCFILSLFVVSASAFLFPMGGGGGGCGCAPPPPPCCAPPPPPPPPPCPCPPPAPSCGCGCGGRKKRAIEDRTAIQGLIEFENPATDLECNSSELRTILIENMHSTAADSLNSVRSALADGVHDHLVICSQGSVNFAAPRDTQYCTTRKSGHFCQIYSLTD